ncbi:MAG: signal recognition particle-docking protein FtsY [Pseudomonadota bacterium]
MTKNFFTKMFGGKKADKKLSENTKKPPAEAQSPEIDDDNAVANVESDVSENADAKPAETVAAQPDTSEDTSEATGEPAPPSHVNDDAAPDASADDTASDNEPIKEEPAASEPEQPSEPTLEPAKEKKKGGWLSRLRGGLTRTSNKIAEGVSAIFTKRKLDDDALEELEDLLVTADLGLAAATKVTETLAKDRFDKEVSDAEVRKALSEIVQEILQPLEAPLSIDANNKPHVILMTGVNGAGKTTTIGKLAAQFKAEGKSVMLAAGDTFRAAAIEQLSAWGERTGAPVVARAQGADAAGLTFDALKDAQEAGVDVLLVDTAGRLQNKKELMDELAKIVRVMRKIDPTAPHDTLLVLDATVGQNAMSQAATFKEVADVSGLVMTKLDGTARGGVLVALGQAFGLPIHFIGVGESVDDLQPFKADAFAQALAGVDA